MPQTLLVQRLEISFHSKFLFTFRIPLKGVWVSNSPLPLLGISTLGRMALYGKCADLNRRSQTFKGGLVRCSDLRISLMQTHSPPMMPKSGKLESHAPLGGILKAKSNLEIVFERAMFGGGWVGRWGWVVGNSAWWGGSCTNDLACRPVCRIPVGGDTPVCMKSLFFLRFLKAPVTKLKPAETNEYVIFQMLPSPSCGHVWWAWLSHPQVRQHSWLEKVKTAVFR